MRRPGELKGSITIEAVFLMPCILFLIFALIYLTFYLHDACVLKSVTNYAVSELVEVRGPKKEEEEIKEMVEESLKKRLLIGKYQGCTVDHFLQRVKLTAYAKVKIPSRIISGLLGRPDLEVRTIGSYHDPEMAVRLGKLTYDELSKTKAYDKMIEILDKVRGKLFE